MKERYGWRVKDGILVEDPREQRCIELVKELRRRGLSYQAIKADIEKRLKQKAENERK